MIKSYEFQGKSVDQALEKASDQLNIPLDKIKHEVLAYGSSGIFGLVGLKKAKIKVTVDEHKAKKARPIALESAPVESAIDEASTSGASGTPVVDTPFLEPEGQARPSAEIMAYGEKALQQIVDSITGDAAVDLRQKEDTLLFSISGGDSGVLIGKRGQTLEAIQCLLEKMINKKSTNRLQVMVDVEGYLEKRKSNLQQMASRMAEKAKRIKKPVTIGQMNAHDRRIVHIHLKEESGIRTQSIGDGYYRKLMIFPKKSTVPKSGNNDSEE